LDDAGRPRLWTLPRELTKGDRVHEVPITAPVGEIVTRLPRFSGGQYLFTTTSGKRPISGFSRAKKTLDETVLLRRQEVALGRRANAQSQGMPGWVLHDLRRTAASGMARLGFPPHVVAAVLNHAPASTQGITAIYNRHRYAAEKRAALEAWAAHVKLIVDGAAGEKCASTGGTIDAVRKS
jgi:integrase